MTDPQPLRVLVVSDDPLARTGIAALLAHEPSFEVAGAVARADADLAEADVLVWDTGRSGEALERPPLAAPMVALVPDERAGAAALALGADGILARDSEVEALVAALHAVAEGLFVGGPGAWRPPESAVQSPLVEPLTAREREVLALIAQGMANKVIARELEISEHTVKFHVASLMAKLRVQSRAEAVAAGYRQGLISL